jgi:hypothetical protein
MAVPPMPTVGVNQLTEYGSRTIIVTVILVVLATLAVLARLWARFLNAFTPVLEDWLLVGGLIFTWGYAAGNIVC